MTQPLVGGGFFTHLEAAYVLGAQIKFHTEIKSFDTLFLIDSNGTVLGQLTQDIGDTTKRLWKGSFNASGAYLIPKDQTRVLGVVARMKTSDLGGKSQEFVQIDSFIVSVRGQDSGNSYDSPPPDLVFPTHQTSLAKITSVSRSGDANGVLTRGSNQFLGAFSIGGINAAQGHLAVTSLAFQVSKSPEVTVSNWQLGASDTNVRVSCTSNGTTVSCDTIPAELGVVTNPVRTLRVFGDVSTTDNAQNPYLQLTINESGNVGANGSIRWSDGNGEFNWVELQAPLAQGILLK